MYKYIHTYVVYIACHSPLLFSLHIYTVYVCRLILIAEKDTVYENFPTPLINRLEKHFVLTSSILKDWQQAVLGDFDVWIDKFSSTWYKSFILIVICTYVRVKACVHLCMCCMHNTFMCVIL